MPKMTKNCWSEARAPGLRCILVIFLLFYCNGFFEFTHIFFGKFSCQKQSDVKIFAQLLNWYSNLHAPTITKMYSTSVKVVTSYKAINLPYENNMSSLVSLVILFHSLSLCSWFLPLFILNSTSAWWKMNANWRSWKNTTKNLKSSVVGNFFFLFFPGGVRKDPIHLVSDWLTDT